MKKKLLPQILDIKKIREYCKQIYMNKFNNLNDIYKVIKNTIYQNGYENAISLYLLNNSVSL